MIAQDCLRVTVVCQSLSIALTAHRPTEKKYELIKSPILRSHQSILCTQTAVNVHRPPQKYEFLLFSSLK